MEPTKTKTSRSSSTLTINGKLYDAATGKALDLATKQPLPKTRNYGSFDVKPSTSVHAGPLKSQTLRRTAVSRPMPSTPRPLAARHTRTITPVAQHPSVSHFGRPESSLPAAAHVVQPSSVLSALNKAEATDRPIGLATQVQNYSPSAHVALPARTLHKPASHRVTEHQLAKAQTHKQKAVALKKDRKNRAGGNGVERSWKKVQKKIRFTAPVIITGIIIFALIAITVLYLTVPALSLFVAAKSAGVEATYPNFVPSGYHFKGPVAYKDGDVSIQFEASGSSAAYTIDQKSTYWDSGAVLDNYVLTRSANYLTYSQGGITIYTFGSQAAWVNDGVLHTIDGSAKLTSDQILSIAASM